MIEREFRFSASLAQHARQTIDMWLATPSADPRAVAALAIAMQTCGVEHARKPARRIWLDSDRAAVALLRESLTLWLLGSCLFRAVARVSSGALFAVVEIGIAAALWPEPHSRPFVGQVVRGSSGDPQPEPKAAPLLSGIEAVLRTSGFYVGRAERTTPPAKEYALLAEHVTSPGSPEFVAACEAVLALRHRLVGGRFPALANAPATLLPFEVMVARRARRGLGLRDSVPTRYPSAFDDPVQWQGSVEMEPAFVDLVRQISTLVPTSGLQDRIPLLLPTSMAPYR